MSALDRRDFLAGAALTTCAALLPERADAAALIEGRVAAFRERWATHRREVLDGMFLDRAGADPEAERLGVAVGEGLGALSTFKDLELVPVEDQAHPAMQALIVDAAAAMGGAIRACREAVESFLAGVDESPDRETHLRAALRSVRLGLGDWRTTVGRQRNLELALLEVEQESAPRALVRRSERLLARIRKLEAVAEGMTAHADQTGLLEVHDPAVRARVEAGRARWAAADAESGGGGDLPLPEERPGVKVGLVVLGALTMGLGIVVGAWVTLAGACAIGCGGAVGGVLLMLLGLGIIGLGIWGGIAIIRAGRGRRRSGEGEVAEGEPDPSWGPRRVVSDDFVPVLAEESWVATTVRREGGRVVLVEATGLVRSPGAWLADADGSRVAPEREALVPGAPIGALVGRVGDDRFFLGRGGVVPEGPDGEIELAVNRHLDGERCLGHFAARVRVFAPDGAA